MKKRSDSDSCDTSSFRRLHKQGQLTLFFLMGILLIAAFAFVWYINTRTAEQQLAAPTEKLITDLLKTGAIPYYVGLCLENVTNEGVVLAGKQGGDLYLDQGGPAPNPAQTEYLADRVKYGISRPPLGIDPDYPEPPGYPGGVGRLDQSPHLDFTHEGRFGEVSLRRLCDKFGANSPLPEHVFGEHLTGTGISHVFCQAPYVYDTVLSTQWQLESFIEHNVVECIDWDSINEETGYEISYLGDPNVTFRLGLSDANIDLFLPLEVKVGGHEPVYTVGDFHYRLPVRLKRIGELASLIATYDSYVLNFNISKDYRSFHLWDSDISVSVTTPLKHIGFWDEVLTIEDAASVIEGDNFVYQFSRQNRLPALDMIDQINNYSDYDIVVMEGDTIFLDPNPPSVKIGESLRNVTYDPDEDNVYYYYTGWKSTCDEVFDYETGKPSKLCSSFEPTHPSLYFRFPSPGGMPDPASWGAVDDEVWAGYPEWHTHEDYSIYSGSYRVTNSLGVELYPNFAPLNWTDFSDMYQETRRNTSYKTSEDDVGPHNVTIWACDESGLCDYQIVRLLVIDHPELHLNGTNPYAKYDENVPYDYASVEDFYLLSADGSTGYVVFELGLVEGYLFIDELEPFEKMVVPPVLVVDLPTAPPTHSRDIRYIWNYTFERDQHLALQALLGVDPGVVHPINLTVPRIDVIPKQMNVTVFECLPFRNEESSSPMWPYNFTDVNPYIASHMCCSAGPWRANTFNLTPDHILPRSQPGSYPPIIIPQPYFDVYNEYGSDATVHAYNPEDPARTNLYDAHEGISSDRIRVWLLPHSIALVHHDIVINVSTDSDVLPYGSWMSSTTPCYGGDPTVGAFEQFTHKDVDTSLVGHTEMSGDVTRELDGTYSVALRLTNDIWTSAFTRFCSGNRGNICSGTAMQDFQVISPCRDLEIDVTKGEIESCQGPDESLQGTVPLDAEGWSCTTDENCMTHPSAIAGRDYICHDSACYSTTAELSCHRYVGTSRSPNSFEKAFELSRPEYPDVLADGTCNPTSICSDDEDEYDWDAVSGRYLMRGATCGYDGCEVPLDAYDCYDRNGQNIENTAPYCVYLPDSEETVPDDNIYGQLYSNLFMCTEDSGEDPVADCRFADVEQADFDQALCDACLRTGHINAPGQSSTYRSGVCCGDDPGEGGFPYELGPIPDAQSPSGKPAGRYGAEICDDYYGYDPAIRDNWIDNNCLYGANCEDSACGGKPGPEGLTCCTTTGHCEVVLQESEYIDCTDNYCDCLLHETDGPDDTAKSMSYTNVETCVASKSEFPGGVFRDRFIRLTGLPAGLHTFTIEATELDGEPGVCYRAVDMYLSSGSVPQDQDNIEISYTVSSSDADGDNIYLAFYNRAVPETTDCLVEVTIS